MRLRLRCCSHNIATPSEEPQLTLVTFNCHCCGITLVGLQRIQFPLRDSDRIEGGADKLRRKIAVHDELIQGECQAIPVRLYERLFPGPAVEERLHLPCFWKVTQRPDFFRREK